MEDSKPVCTPMVTGCSLNSNDESATVHQPTYRSMIGNLLYLTGTQPDIMHAVGIVGRFQPNPKESHLQAVKRIFKYLQGTDNFGLWYRRDTDLTLHAYTDADWVGSIGDKKSTSGGAFNMGSIALSAAEVEYVATTSCFTQLLWMMQTLQDIHITCTPPISILCDNTSAISISNNLVMHSNTKHVPMKYHFLCEEVPEQKVKLEHVPSKEQVADLVFVEMTVRVEDFGFVVEVVVEIAMKVEGSDFEFMAIDFVAEYVVEDNSDMMEDIGNIEKISHKGFVLLVPTVKSEIEVEA
eukprot:PITA_29074